jgi:hypothetical protein
VALQSSTLKRGLLDLTHSFPRTYEEAAKRWAEAYATYAKDAQSPLGGSPATLAAAQAALAAALAPVFATSRDPVTTSARIAAALTQFWLTPPVAFTGTPPGLVTAVLGTAALAAALPPLGASMARSHASADQAMGQLAAAFDAFTRTVIVLHPVVPAPVVGPII